MRDLRILDRYRVEIPAAILPEGQDARGDERNGAFVIPLTNELGHRLAGSKPGERLRVIAASGGGWDHVSVSLEHRTPTWEEMSLVHRLFFKEGEIAYQLHVPEKDHINCHPNCLHLWRKQGFAMPLPPKDMV